MLAAAVVAQSMNRKLPLAALVDQAAAALATKVEYHQLLELQVLHTQAVVAVVAVVLQAVQAW
jgi:hypothetical protein